MAFLTPISFFETHKVDNEGAVIESTTLLQRAQITVNDELWDISWYSEENTVLAYNITNTKAQYYTISIPATDSKKITWQNVCDAICPRLHRVVFEYVEGSCDDIDSDILNRTVYENIVFQASIVSLE